MKFLHSIDRALSVESLERRMMLAGDAFAHITSKGTLDVRGNSSANQISVVVSGSSVLAFCDGESLSFSAAAVKRVGVSGGDGDDVIVLGPAVPSIALGQDGDDTITGGAGDDFLDGGDGDDVLNGGSGDNQLFGGPGTDWADYFEASEPYAISVGRADAGIDSIAIPRRRMQGNFPRLQDGAGEIDVFVDALEFFGGTSFDDFVLRADGVGERDDPAPTVDARGGDDLFRASGDRVEGDLIGGAGNDQFQLDEDFRGNAFGGSGNDLFDPDESLAPARIRGDGGNDTLDVGGIRRDFFDLNDFAGVENLIRIGSVRHGRSIVVIGTDGPNLLQSDEIDEPKDSFRIYGLAGDDTLIGNISADALFGGDGDDSIIGGNGNDTLRGEDGNDAIGGNGGSDRIYGHGGNDNLSGGSGADRLYGSTGTDTFNGGAGNDFLFSRDDVAEGVNGADGDDSAEADDELDALFSVENELP